MLNAATITVEDPTRVEHPADESRSSYRDFPLKEARALARDLHTPNPLIYWSDFLASAILGWGAFVLAVLAAPLSVPQLLAMAVAVLALYRAVIFTHELSHIRSNRFRVFRLVWNLLCGVPLMFPSFMYRGVHLEHHQPRMYGTHEDGEYLPFALGSRLGMLLFIAHVLILPPLIAARFLLLAPLAWMSPTLRRLIWQRASSLSIDFSYRRPLSGMANSRDWRWQEPACCLFGFTAIALVVLGHLPAAMLAVWYVVTATTLLLNAVRTLAAHRYRNPGDHSLSGPEHFLDSVDIPGNNWLTPLWAPVGLRYHATHHLFPGMPYHNLGRAHRKLVAELSDNRLYLAATRRSLWQALGDLWRETGKTVTVDHQGAAPALWR